MRPCKASKEADTYHIKEKTRYHTSERPTDKCTRTDPSLSRERKAPRFHLDDVTSGRPVHAGTRLRARSDYGRSRRERLKSARRHASTHPSTGACAHALMRSAWLNVHSPRSRRHAYRVPRVHPLPNEAMRGGRTDERAA